MNETRWFSGSTRKHPSAAAFVDNVVIGSVSESRCTVTKLSALAFTNRSVGGSLLVFSVDERQPATTATAAIGAEASSRCAIILQMRMRIPWVIWDSNQCNRPDENDGALSRPENRSTRPDHDHAARQLRSDVELGRRARGGRV